jgi:hypothetical protein
VDSRSKDRAVRRASEMRGERSREGEKGEEAEIVGWLKAQGENWDTIMRTEVRLRILRTIEVRGGRMCTNMRRVRANV